MAITASEARRNLFGLVEQVNEDRSAVEITSRKGNAVLMAVEDYEAWVETAYLFRNPANARHLLASYEEALAGKAKEFDLLDEDESSAVSQV